MAAAYSASKAAVIGLTKSIGKDVATTGVLVNCVTPAPVETPMLGEHQPGAPRLHALARADGPARDDRGGRGADRLLGSDRMTFSTGAAFDLSGGRLDVLMATFVPRGWRLVRLGGGCGAAPRSDRSGGAAGRARAARARPDRRAAPRPRRRRRGGRRRARRRRPGHARAGLPLLAPLAPEEIWAAGVTYERSRSARVEESESAADVYDLVYEAERPEIFLKDAGCRRTVGPNEPVGVRSESTWTVPEPELGLVLGADGEILAFTAGNDLTARDIEAANPLYIPQAKLFAACCAIGPAVLVPDDPGAPLEISVRIWDAAGDARQRGRHEHGETAPQPRGARRLVRAREPRARRARCCSRAPASCRPTRSRWRPATASRSRSRGSASSPTPCAPPDVPCAQLGPGPN